MTVRILARSPTPDGGGRYRLPYGRSLVVADGTADGDGWTWALLDGDGVLVQTGRGAARKGDALASAKAAAKVLW